MGVWGSLAITLGAVCVPPPWNCIFLFLNRRLEINNDSTGIARIEETELDFLQLSHCVTPRQGLKFKTGKQCELWWSIYLWVPIFGSYMNCLLNLHNLFRWAFLLLKVILKNHIKKIDSLEVRSGQGPERGNGSSHTTHPAWASSLKKRVQNLCGHATDNAQHIPPAPTWGCWAVSGTWLSIGRKATRFSGGLPPRACQVYMWVGHEWS